jgi:hypothetical protein
VEDPTDELEEAKEELRGGEFMSLQTAKEKYDSRTPNRNMIKSNGITALFLLFFGFSAFCWFFSDFFAC